MKSLVMRNKTVKVILSTSMQYETKLKEYKCTWNQAMTTLLPLKQIVLNIDKATIQLQMFLKPPTPVSKPQQLDVSA